MLLTHDDFLKKLFRAFSSYRQLCLKFFDFKLGARDFYLGSCALTFKRYAVGIEGFEFGYKISVASQERCNYGCAGNQKCADVFADKLTSFLVK